MAKKEKIAVIITGGTIDSYYEGIKDTVVPLEKSSIPQYLKGLKMDHAFSFYEICMKDSRSINLNDRKNILKIVERENADEILITHGTYTMPGTARYICKFNKK